MKVGSSFSLSPPFSSKILWLLDIIYNELVTDCLKTSRKVSQMHCWKNFYSKKFWQVDSPIFLQQTLFYHNAMLKVVLCSRPMDAPS